MLLLMRRDEKPVAKVAPRLCSFHFTSFFLIAPRQCSSFYINISGFQRSDTMAATTSAANATSGIVMVRFSPLHDAEHAMWRDLG